MSKKYKDTDIINFSFVTEAQKIMGKHELKRIDDFTKALAPNIDSIKALTEHFRSSEFSDRVLKWQNEISPQINTLKEIIADAEDVLFKPGAKISDLESFVNKAHKQLDIVRKKIKTSPKKSTNDNREIALKHLIKEFEKMKSQLKGKKTELFNFRDRKYTNKEICNILSAKVFNGTNYPKWSAKTLLRYYRKYKNEF